jgi:cytochrome c oxidase subunit 2
LNLLQGAGPIAEAIADIGIVLIVGALLIFAGVMGLLVATLRRRDGAQRRVDKLLWVAGGGLVFPSVVLTVLLVYALLRSDALTSSPDGDALVVGVTAKMWWWEVRYRDPASGGEVVLANEIHVPVGRRVTLGVSSSDVLHSVWVPAIAGKIDTVPGRVHQLRFEVRAPGVYRGQCAEYCGEQHARMALHVVAHSPADFERWLAAQARPAAVPTDALAQRGLQVFVQQRCSACHNVRGIAEGTRLGPDLTHVGSRMHIGAGTLAMHRDNLAQWVADIQKQKSGARMPAFSHLDPPSLRALGVFLEELK